jgi:hypothetical protein
MIYAQHGFQKSTMIEQGLTAGVIGGVILSPQNESEIDLSNYIAALRGQYGQNLPILIDPLLQALTYPQPKMGQLVTYTCYPQPPVTMNTLTVPSNVIKIVGDILDFQFALPVSYIVAPTVILDSFNGTWAPVVLSLMSQAVAHLAQSGDTRPLLLSLVVSENAFSNTVGLNQFLNAVTALDAAGFYFVLHRLTGDYPAPITPNQLENVMALTRSLGSVNGYTFIVGYSDLIGVNLHSVGATATSTGWFFGCRQHTDRKFVASRGSSPLARYTSGALMTSILVSELQTAHNVGAKAQLLTNGQFDQDFVTQLPNQVAWNRTQSTLHHWDTLNRLVQPLQGANGLTQKLDILEAMLQNARQTFSNTQQLGVPFSLKTGPRDIVSFMSAVAQFRQSTGL